MKNNFLYFILYLLPFFVIHVFSLTVCEDSFLVARTDASEFLFSTGIGILEKCPLLEWHMPGYGFSEISALICLFSGIESSDYARFSFLGYIFQIFVLFLSSIWVFNLGNRLKLNKLSFIILGCIGAFYPTAMAYSKIWGHNYLLSVLMVPLGLELYLAVVKKESSSWNKFSFFIGVLSSTFFALLPINGILPLLLLFKEYKIESNELIRFSFINICRLIAANLFVFSGIVYCYHSLMVAVCICGIFTLMFFLCVNRYNFFRQLWNLVLGNFVLGWFVAVNFFFMHWFQSLFSAMGSKGGAGSGIGFLEGLINADYIWFILHSPYFVNFIILIVVVLCLLNNKRYFKIGRLGIVLIAVYSVFCLILLVDPAMFKRIVRVGDYGIATDRYFLFLPMLFTFFWLSIRSLKHINLIVFSLFFSVLFFIKDQLEYNREYQKTVMHVNKAKTDWLDRGVNNLFVCMRVAAIDSDSSYLYAMNNYATPFGEHNDNRFLYLNDVSSYGSSIDVLYEINRANKNDVQVSYNNVMILHEGNPPFEIENIFFSEVLNIGVSRL